MAAVSFYQNRWIDAAVVSIVVPDDDVAEEVGLFSIAMEVTYTRDTRYAGMRSGAAGLIDGPLPIPPIGGEQHNAQASVLLQSTVFPREFVAMAFDGVGVLQTLTDPLQQASSVESRMGNSSVGAIFPAVFDSSFVRGAANGGQANLRDSRTFTGAERAAVQFAQPPVYQFFVIDNDDQFVDVSPVSGLTPISEAGGSSEEDDQG